MMARRFLVEIGTEEMPGSLAQLKQLAEAALKENRIPFREIKVFGTPRRLAFAAEGVAEEQETAVTSVKGPSVKIAFDAEGKPTKAALGFAAGQGITAEGLTVQDGYIYAVRELAGAKTVVFLPEIVDKVVHGLAFPKTMRWADFDFRFVRPLRWIVALFGDETVPFTVTDVVSGRETLGHRFLSEGRICLKSAEDYETVLREHYVLVEQDERKKLIRAQIEDVAAREGGIAAIDEELLEEVLYLVEYPTALCGHFDDKFLSLPREAIITPMREHQRYFPVLTQDGKLLPKFITVRNGGEKHLELVTHGNERVLRARLSDAEFFFNEDKKLRLDERLDSLKKVVFQEGLGNIYDKTQRLQRLAALIGKEVLPTIDQDKLMRTALLAKTDLVTGMVGEFTELQGVMGREYALLDGEAAEVATGIYEHYLPRYAGDALPGSAYGRIIGLADKIDNIAATFGRGLIPTGSQDPYALRRQAIGIINILAAAGYHLELPVLTRNALNLLGFTGDEAKMTAAKIDEFFRQRIVNILAEKQIRYDVAEAVLAAEEYGDAVDIFTRAEALQEYVQKPEAGTTVQAFVRVFNLAKNGIAGGVVNDDLLTEPAEKKLCAVVRDLQKDLLPALIKYDYAAVLTLSEKLTEPINDFFGAVMVMDKDERIKNNRLALLEQVQDVGKLVGALNLIVL